MNTVLAIADTDRTPHNIERTIRCFISALKVTTESSMTTKCTELEGTAATEGATISVAGTAVTEGEAVSVAGAAVAEGVAMSVAGASVTEGAIMFAEGAAVTEDAAMFPEGVRDREGCTPPRCDTGAAWFTLRRANTLASAPVRLRWSNDLRTYTTSARDNQPDINVGHSYAPKGIMFCARGRFAGIAENRCASRKFCCWGAAYWIMETFFKHGTM